MWLFSVVYKKSEDLQQEICILCAHDPKSMARLKRIPVRIHINLRGKSLQKLLESANQ
jgi:hypothetical protein